MLFNRLDILTSCQGLRGEDNYLIYDSFYIHESQVDENNKSKDFIVLFSKKLMLSYKGDIELRGS